MARIKVVSAPLGRPATVLTDSGQIIHGYEAPGPDSKWMRLGENDFVFEGEEVVHEVYDELGTLIFDHRGRQQLGQKPGGGVELIGAGRKLVDRIEKVGRCARCGRTFLVEQLDQDGDCSLCAAGGKRTGFPSMRTRVSKERR